MYKYTDAISILIEEFPELLQFYDEDYEDLRYPFYETEFGKYIMQMIYEKNTKELSRIFDFTECLLLYGDKEMKNLAGVGLVENMFFEKEFMNRYDELSKEFGTLTKKALKIASIIGCPIFYRKLVYL